MVLPRSLVVPASRHKAPQSGLWLLLSSSGRHSEEPRVVVTRATRTAQNSTGHSRRFVVGVFLVTYFAKKSAATFRQHTVTSWSSEYPARRVLASRRRRTTVSSDTKPRRIYCHHGCGMPSLSLFQGCERRLVLQAPRTKIGAPLTRGLLLCGHAKQRA